MTYVTLGLNVSESDQVTSIKNNFNYGTEVANIPSDGLVCLCPS